MKNSQRLESINYMTTPAAYTHPGRKIIRILLLAIITFTVAVSARQVLAVTVEMPSYRVAKPDELIQTVMLNDGSNQCVGLVEEEGATDDFWPTSGWDAFSSIAYNIVPYPTKTYYAPAASAPESWFWPCNYPTRKVTEISDQYGYNAKQGATHHETTGRATICLSGESLGEAYCRQNNVPVTVPTKINSRCDYELSGVRVSAQQQACSLVYHGTQYNYNEVAEVRDATGTLNVVTVRTDHRPPQNNECPDLSAVDGLTIPIDINQPVRGIYDEQREVFTALDKDLTSAETCQKLDYTYLSDPGMAIAQIKAQAQEEARQGAIRDRNNSIMEWCVVSIILAVIAFVAVMMIRFMIKWWKRFHQGQATGREFWTRSIIASFAILMMLLLLWSIIIFFSRKTA